MGYSNGVCTICNSHNENIEHLIVTCVYLKDVWLFIEKCLMRFCKNINGLTTFMKIVGFLEKVPLADEVNMVLAIVRWEIWKSRCKKKYDDGPEEHINLFRNILRNLKNHIKVLLQGNIISRKHSLEMLLRIFD